MVVIFFEFPKYGYGISYANIRIQLTLIHIVLRYVTHGKKFFSKIQKNLSRTYACYADVTREEMTLPEMPPEIRDPRVTFWL